MKERERKLYRKRERKCDTSSLKMKERKLCRKRERERDRDKSHNTHSLATTTK